MMRTVLALSLAAAATQACASEATAFVQGLYSHYGANGSGVEWNGKSAARIFDAELAALIKKDSSGGEVGAIDGDPICDCQDYDIKHVVVQEDETAPDRVTAQVAFENIGQPQALTLLLHRTAKGWRISDIGSKDQPSLLAYLRRELGKS